MRMRTAIQLLAFIGLIMISFQVGQWVQPGPTTARAQDPKTFQYKIVEVTTDLGAMQRMLNDYGSAGWELVAVGLGDLTSPRLIFKR